MPVRISGFGLLACLVMLWRSDACSCQEYGPCEYEEVQLAADDITPWATRVGDDMARLLGPYEGIWRWEEDHAALDFDQGGAEIPATATITLDPATYRLIDPIYTGHTVCTPETIAADGTMTFTDDQGDVITSFGFTVTREVGIPSYLSYSIIQPVEAFSDEVHTLRDYDVDGIKIAAYWSEDGSELSVYIEYGAQSELTATSGHGTLAGVATFMME
jgi:hypothetical protein